MTGDKSERFDRDALVAALQEAGVVLRGRECRCPFHDDKRASAAIYQTQGGVWRFKCHSCDAAGDVFDIRARVRGVPLADVLAKSREDARNSENRRSITPRERQSPAQTCHTLAEIAAHAGGRVQAVYDYSPDFAVVRVIGADGRKTFRQCHRDGAFWTWGAPPKPWPLYGRKHIGDTKILSSLLRGRSALTRCVPSAWWP